MKLESDGGWTAPAFADPLPTNSDGSDAGELAYAGREIRNVHNASATMPTARIFFIRHLPVSVSSIAGDQPLKVSGPYSAARRPWSIDRRPVTLRLQFSLDLPLSWSITRCY